MWADADLVGKALQETPVDHAEMFKRFARTDDGLLPHVLDIADKRSDSAPSYRHGSLQFTFLTADALTQEQQLVVAVATSFFEQARAGSVANWLLQRCV